MKRLVVLVLAAASVSLAATRVVIGELVSNTG